MRRVCAMFWGAAVACVFVIAGVQDVHAQGASFDHFSTGFPLTGSHRTVDCGSCHVSGRFKATPTQCVSCHNGAQTSGKPVNHPKTTNRCEACHQTTRWSDIRVIDHTQATAACSACHNGSSARGKPPTHMPTKAPCENCHKTTASFALGTKMDHTGITAGCATCHNGTTALGKPNNHVPTIMPCETCHTSTVSFAIVLKFDHTGVTSGCASCHNNVTALGKSGNHVPTTLPCETCHASTVSFAGAFYQHKASDTYCVGCHDNAVAPGMATPPHIPARGVQCSECHTNTAPSFATYTMNHSAVAGSRCDTCHNAAYTTQGNQGAFGTAQRPNHVPTGGQDCITCHANAATSHISWAGATFVHQPSDSNCASCHNGAIAQGQSNPPHIPIGAAQCSNCHTSAASSFTTYNMNHAVVSASRCDSCHNGSFVNEGTAGAQGTASFASHVATSGRDCIACHSTAAASFSSWRGGKYVHAASDASCSSCHNGSNATGMSTPPHVPSGTVQCGNCHSNSATSFATYSMNHTAVAAIRCDACHSGAYTGEGSKGAQGTSAYPGHIPTGGRDCLSCHTSAAPAFTSFAGAVYAHLPTDTNCSNCHNGTTATGKSTSHVPVGSVQCSSCHSNTAISFASYTMDHAAVSSSRCDSCHNGSYANYGTKGALGTSSYPGHVPTNGQDCVACHAAAGVGFASWTGGVYAHQPGDTNCSNCHNGTAATGASTPPHIPVSGIQCSNCHSNTAASFTTYTMSHAAVSASRCDACHNGSYTSQGTKGALGTSAYPGHVFTAGRDCSVCHTGAMATFSSWVGGAYAHAPSDTNCVSCHDGLMATGMTTPPHVPTGPTQCSNCHNNTAASFVTYTMSHAAVSALRCDACHNGSYTSQGTSGALGTASYPGHVSTNGSDCVTCHAKATVNFTTWSGGSFVHGPSDTNCVNCHNSKTATGLTTPPQLPTATTQCSNCHTSTAASFTAYTMNHAAVATVRCDACHNGSFASQGTSGAQGTSSYPNHVVTAGRDCVTCHGATGFTSWAGGLYVHQAADTNCTSCHNGTTAKGLTAPPHIPTSTIQCSNCHSNTAASFATYTMNHAAVATARCDSCHNGSYTGQGSKGAYGTASYAGHVATSGADCATCHTKAVTGGYVTWSGAIYAHQAGDTNCSNCHNGTAATGHTTPPHVPIGTVQCSNCHSNTATSFITYTMSHAAVSYARCDSCHNGSYTSQGNTGAYGTANYPGHVATNGQDCVACHAKAATSFTSWAGGSYVHQPSDTNCISCHGGGTATGMNTPPHIPSGTVQCSNCHSSTAASFATYTMSHASVSAVRCDACHNGSYTTEGARGAQGTASYPNHVATSGQDCAVCHASAAATFTSWTGGTYVHQPADTACSNCHNGKTALGLTTPPHVPVGTVQCSSCHNNTAASFTTYTMTHSAVSASRCDSCHNGSYLGEGTKGAQGTVSFPGHVATNGWDCITCHASAATTFTSWAGGKYTHQAGDTNCASCHNNTIAPGMTTPPHIPSATVQCSHCHTNTAASFTTYVMTHSAVSAIRCDACHNGSFTAQGTSGALGTASYPNHIATAGRDCVTCHAAAAASFTSWAGATYSHVATDTNCSSCHNGTNALGMTTPPHIPSATVQCSNCHNSNAASFTTYTMNHASVSATRCDACHNGSYTSQGTKGAYATTAYAGHVATTGRDCISCHASAASGGYVSWAGGVYSHQPTDTNCINCHNGTTATGMTTPPHIPASGIQCSNCHNSTAASFTSYTMSHAGVSAARCDSCHNGSYTSQGNKGAYGIASYPGHIGTAGQDCITCHSAAASGGYVSWAGGTYSHQPGDTNCINCHNGTTATGNTTPPHIPATGIQCSNCHSNTAASFLTYTMNHAAVSAARCDTCHNGSYTSQGTKGAYGTASYPGHVATAGRDCVTCHAAAVGGGYMSWAAGTYTHQATDTNCVNCHNGKAALGLTTPPHIPTGTIQCSNCHSNTAASFATYTMTHTAVSGMRCDACHNGSYTAEGTKGALGTASYPNHIATGGRDCVTCHASAAASYTSWAGGGYVHQATDTNCSTCHNGTTALGLTTPPHIPTGTIQCSNCHTNTAASFVTYTMNHTAVSAVRCDACHNGSYTAEGTKGAMGTASYANHVTTGGRDCVTCHATAATSFASWSGGTYVHLGTDTNCTACHNRTTALGLTTPPHIPTGTIQCSNCHTSSALSFVTYTMNHAAVSSSRCDACHNGSYTSQGTKGALGIASYAGHVATGGRDCIACHASAATNFSSWSGGMYTHQAADTNCISCHNGTTATGLTTPPHIPTGTIQCSNCHSSTATSFTTYTMKHTAVTGTRCDACHNGSYTSQGTKGAYGTASYAGHVPTNGKDCASCHAKAVSGGYVSWSGGTYTHAAADTNCSSCHNGATATGLTTPPHIPVPGIQCSNCHTSSATSFTTYTMSHAAVHATRCDTCHSGAYKSQGTKGARGPDHRATSQDCGCCHVKSTTTFTSWSGEQKPAAGCVTTAKTLVPAKPTTLAVLTKSVQSVVTRTISGVTSVVRSAASKLTGTAPQSRSSGTGVAPKSTPMPTATPLPPATPVARSAKPSPAPSTSTSLVFNSKPVSTSTFAPAATAPAAPGTAVAPSAGARTNPSVSNFAKVAPVASGGVSKPAGTTATPAVVPSPAPTPAVQNLAQAPASVVRSMPPPAIGPSGATPPSFGPSTLTAGNLKPGFGSMLGARFNHSVGQGPCVSCHNGRDATGKPPKHIVTNAPCETCHKSTTTFAGARFTHTAATVACATCHNGATALGKSPKHVATTASCETCHKSTTTFAGARFDHKAATAACATCHNGATALGKSPKHVATTASCETCHKSTTTFAGARFD
ncbi:MAG: hypothetical protein HY852_08730, partial [Bradyrhizobium sp.]|nr:hypothetical protein [Bradyrhizobium sp.]